MCASSIYCNRFSQGHWLVSILWTSTISPSICSMWCVHVKGIYVLLSCVDVAVLTVPCRDPLVMQGGEECSDLYNNVASFEDGYAQICKLNFPFHPSHSVNNVHML